VEVVIWGDLDGEGGREWDAVRIEDNTDLIVGAGAG